MKMHGPDTDKAIIAVPTGVAPGLLAPTHMTLADLHKIIYDRLDYVRISRINRALVGQDEKRVNIPLSELCDIEAVTQQAMVEVRKKLGLYKDDLDYKPPHTVTLPPEPKYGYFDAANNVWIDEKPRNE